ncbi:MAG: hypothetical protein B6D44_06725 [Ignavibacteriales bacterium UTCHB2]|nr:MAG: hypothetical protein B6D44_06725 [Ignavibacteriales bacterium UTCHB2]
MYYPKISIVTISFNQAAFLEKTILSILGQDYPNIEYIIIDGGSSDESISIIKKHENKIHYWCSEPDDGPASALNKGFAIASGDFFTFLNSDDIFLPNTFIKVIKTFQKHNNIDVIYGNGLQLNELGNITRKLYSSKWNFRRFIFGESNIIQQSVFFKKEIFQKVNGFNEKNHTCWDGELWARFGLAKGNFFYLNEFLGGFRVHKDSITGSSRLNDKYIAEIKALREDLLRSFNVSSYYNPRIAKLERIVSSPLHFIRSSIEKLKYEVLKRNDYLK